MGGLSKDGRAVSPATCFAAVLVALWFAGCQTASLPPVDQRVHGPSAAHHAEALFRAADDRDPMKYFYGVHYSTASCGLSRWPYLPARSDVLVPLFSRCAVSPCCPARWEILKELGCSGDRRAVPALVRALEDPSLGGFGADHAEESLGMLRDPRAVGPLVNRIRQHKATRHAFYSLASINTPEAIDALCHVLDANASEEYRREAAIALAWVGAYKSALNGLLRAHKQDASAVVRTYAACGLVLHARDANAFGFLLARLRDSNLPVRRAAAECVCFRLPMTQRTIPHVIATLRDGDSETASYAWEELDKRLNDGSVEGGAGGDYAAMAEQYQKLFARTKNDWPKE